MNKVLKDCNNIEIQEYDVIQSDDGNYYKCFRDNKTNELKFVIKFRSKITSPIKNYNEILKPKIIGNVIDNPHLDRIPSIFETYP